MDTGTSYHISGNKLLLSYIVYSQSLHVITLANGIQTKPKRISKLIPYPFISLTGLYDPSCPFNLAYVSRLTRALNCAVRFQGTIPLHFCEQCMLSAVYLINRLPSVVLGGEFPNEFFHK